MKCSRGDPDRVSGVGGGRGQFLVLSKSQVWGGGTLLMILSWSQVWLHAMRDIQTDTMITKNNDFSIYIRPDEIRYIL